MMKIKLKDNEKIVYETRLIYINWIIDLTHDCVSSRKVRNKYIFYFGILIFNQQHKLGSAEFN